MPSRVREFFEVFAGNTLNPEVVGSCFADPFLSADASGSRPVPLDVFLAALPRRAQMFADAGVGPAALTSLVESHLDEHYVLVRTEWAAPRLSGGEPLRLASSYLLHDDGNSLRIVLYLNHSGLPDSTG
jgi:hypothetical protein